MGVTNMIQGVPNFLMKLCSSVSFLAEKAEGNIAFSILNLATRIFSFIGEVLYAVSKWILYFVDILFFYIQQLAGMNMDTSSLSSLMSKDSDIVFNFMLSNSATITQIIRALLGISLILIIVFTIVAIIKGQYESLQKGKPVAVHESIMSSLKAILLMFLTPIIAIIGIVASNLLLKSLYNATNVSGAVSLSTQLFSVASDSSNRYRNYAMSGLRIPITYDFTKQEEIIDYYRKHGASSKMQEYLVSTDNAIYATHLMFNDEAFETFVSLDATDDDMEAYYQIYDKSLVNGGLSQYKRIRAHSEEYYVMGDVLNYAITSSSVLYMKTIEEVLTSIRRLPSTVNEGIFQSIVTQYGIAFYDAGNLNTPVSDPTLNNQLPVFRSGGWDVIRWTNTYFSANDEGEPVGRKQIQYNHVRRMTDELEGAVYIMAGEANVVVDGVTYSYYVPISKGYNSGSGKDFESEYIERNKIVAAKGIFNASGYPTAIKQSDDGSEVIFYRNDLQQVTIGENGKILSSGYEQEEKEEQGFFSRLVSFIKDLFNPAKWLPFLNFNKDEVMISYSKIAVQSGKLANGEFHVGYMFSDNLTARLSGDMYGLKLYTLFNPVKINYLVLVMGAYLLGKICFLSVFALIKRAYDLLLIIITYPATLATMPIDKGKGYQGWMRMYIQKLLITYGLLLGFNFVLMLFPIINTIKFFTAQDLVMNAAVARFSGIFSAVGISINAQVNILNLLFAIILELAAFSMLEGNKGGGTGIYEMIMKIVNPDSPDSLYNENPGAMMLKTVQDAGVAVAKVTSAVIGGLSSVVGLLTKPGQMAMAKKIKDHRPGSAIIEDHKKKAAMKNAQAQSNETMNTLKDPDATKEDAEGAMNDLKNAQNQALGKGGDKKPEGGEGGGADDKKEAPKEEKKEEKPKEPEKKEPPKPSGGGDKK